jgi:hypothetical protein
MIIATEINLECLMLSQIKKTKSIKMNHYSAKIYLIMLKMVLLINLEMLQIIS